MARRPDPDRIYAARRAATFNRLTATRVIDELDAEHWIARWEREAEVSERARDDHYWADAWAWITESQRRK